MSFFLKLTHTDMKYFPLQFTEEDVYFSYLPLAHVYDQIMENYCIYKGSSIGFWQGVKNYFFPQLHSLHHFLYPCLQSSMTTQTWSFLVWTYYRISGFWWMTFKNWNRPYFVGFPESMIVYTPVNFKVNKIKIYRTR